jgi:hypothetical protein
MNLPEPTRAQSAQFKKAVWRFLAAGFLFVLLLGSLLFALFVKYLQPS